MIEKEPNDELVKYSKILSSSENLKDYIFTREGGIDFQESLQQPNGIRKANTGFKHLEQELRALYENQNKNSSTSSDDKNILRNLRDRMHIYSAKQNEYYQEFLLADSNLTLLLKPENNQKNIDTQVIKDDLGVDKANSFFSAYLVKHQNEIRNNKERLNSNDIDNLFEGFSAKNKIGLNGNNHYVTIDLIKQGPMNNEQFFKFIEDNSEFRNKTDAYYYNIEQKGWKSFKNSEAMQLAYLRNDIAKSDDPHLKQSFITNKQKNEFDSLFEGTSFKEVVQEEPPKKINRLRYNI